MIISEHLNNFEQGLMSNKKTEDTFDTSHPVYRDLVERVGKVDTRLCKTNLEKTSLYENALKEALQNEYPDKHWSEITDCDIRTTLLESGNDIDKTARKIVESFKVQEKKPAVKKTTGVLAENMRKKSLKEAKSLEEDTPRDLLQGIVNNPAYSRGYKGYGPYQNQLSYGGNIDFNASNATEVTPEEIMRMKKNGEPLDKIFIVTQQRWDKHPSVVQLDKDGHPREHGAVRGYPTRKNQSLKSVIDEYQGYARNGEVKFYKYDYKTSYQTHPERFGEPTNDWSEDRKRMSNLALGANSIKYDKDDRAQARYYDSNKKLQEPIKKFHELKSKLYQAQEAIDTYTDNLKDAKARGGSSWDFRRADDLKKQIAQLQAELDKVQSRLSADQGQKEIDNLRKTVNDCRSEYNDIQVELDRLLRRGISVDKLLPKTDESLKESAEWKYTLSCSDDLESSIDSGDLEEVVEALKGAYDELVDQELFDEGRRDKVFSALEQIDVYDDGAEAKVEKKLDQFYNVCDKLGVKISFNESLDETWAEMRDGKPSFFYDNERDAKQGSFWSRYGDAQYGMGNHTYEVKQVEGDPELEKALDRYNRTGRMRESLKEAKDREVDRREFASLIKYGVRDPKGNYAILNDGNFVKAFWADSDEEAKEIFSKWSSRKSESLMGKLNEANDGVVTFDLNTDVVNSIDPGMYGSAIDFPEQAKDTQENYKMWDDIVVEQAIPYIEEAVQKTDSRIKVKNFKINHPKFYNFVSDCIDFDVELPQALLMELFEKYKNDQSFLSYLKDNYHSRDGFISTMAYTPEEFEKQCNDAQAQWKSLSQILSYNAQDEFDDRQREFEDDVLDGSYWWEKLDCYEDEYVGESLQRKSESLKEGVSKKEVIDAIIADQGCSKKEAEKQFKEMSDERKELLAQGFKENAKKSSLTDSLKEDTVKQGSSWVNKGKEGTHGKFKTKKGADAQRKAMFANGYKEGLKESYEDFTNVDVLAKAIDDAYDDLVSDPDGGGCYTLKLDNRLAVCVGWEDGFEPEDTPFGDGWDIVTGIKVWTSDDMRTDYEWINAPFYRGGDVWDTTTSIGKGDGKSVASWLLKEYEEMKNLEISKQGEILEESCKSRRKGKKLTEAPIYDLTPQYDSRNSFYSKAKVDTGDKGDKNRLYSYNTLVAEIKDGKPVVYGTYSATTLRHIKDWLRQNGFKADSAKQIMADYGTKDEALTEKEGSKEVKDSPFDYERRLLARLKSDCDYTLGACKDNGSSFEGVQKHFWAGNSGNQIAKMRELHQLSKDMDDIVTDSDIDTYEKRFRDWSKQEALTERNLTKSERHNRDMHRIFSDYNAMLDRMKDYLRKNTEASDEEIETSYQNTGLGSNSNDLWGLLKKYGVHDDFFAQDGKRKNESFKSKGGKKPLTEGTSNFWSMDYFPLLVFGDYESAWEYADQQARDEIESDYDNMTDEEIEAYEEDAFNDPRYENLLDKAFDEYFDYCLLDEEEFDSLKDDIDSFNDSMKKKYYYGDEMSGTNSLDGEEWDGVYPSVEIKPGYYEAEQLYVNVEPKHDVIQDYKFFIQEQVDEVNKFLEEMKKKYRLTDLEVSYRFSNGETGYSKK